MVYGLCIYVIFFIILVMICDDYWMYNIFYENLEIYIFILFGIYVVVFIYIMLILFVICIYLVVCIIF